MSAGGYEIGLSSSEAVSQRLGGGQWNINEGGGSGITALLLVGGVIVVAAVLVLMLFRRR